MTNPMVNPQVLDKPGRETLHRWFRTPPDQLGFQVFITGWWFQTFLFPIIYGIILPIWLIFCKMVKTTNQIISVSSEFFWPEGPWLKDRSGIVCLLWVGRAKNWNSSIFRDAFSQVKGAWLGAPQIPSPFPAAFSQPEMAHRFKALKCTRFEAFDSVEVA